MDVSTSLRRVRVHFHKGFGRFSSLPITYSHFYLHGKAAIRVVVVNSDDCLKLTIAEVLSVRQTLEHVMSTDGPTFGRTPIQFQKTQEQQNHPEKGKSEVRWLITFERSTAPAADSEVKPYQMVISIGMSSGSLNRRRLSIAVKTRERLDSK